MVKMTSAIKSLRYDMLASMDRFRRRNRSLPVPSGMYLILCEWVHHLGAKQS